MIRWTEIDAYLTFRGIRIGEPTVGQTIGGSHAAGSYHYLGLARDYGDANSDCLGVLNALLPFAKPGGAIIELFYAPTNTWLKNGVQLSRAAIGDHDDHVHAAISADTAKMLLVGKPVDSGKPIGLSTAALAAVVNQ